MASGVGLIVVRRFVSSRSVAYGCVIPALRRMYIVQCIVLRISDKNGAAKSREMIQQYSTIS